MNSYFGPKVPCGPIVTTSWDDGHICDLKLADLLYKYRVPATFYPVLVSEKHPLVDRKQIKELSKIFEIGSHTRSHINLCKAPEQIVIEELHGSKAELEDMVGNPIDMFCYPWGKYDSNLRKALINAGFLGARTTRRYCINPRNDPWLMPTTVTVFPFPPIWRFKHTIRTCNFGGMRELLKFNIGSSWVQIANHYFQKVLKDGGVFHLWGHSWEIEKHGLWADLTLILETISNISGVEYMTNGQLVKKIYG